MDKTCPHCGAPLPPEASFCPRCARSLRPRQAVDAPAPSRGRRAGRVALAALLAALILGAGLCAALAPHTYEAWGELTYTLGENAYRLALSFRGQPSAEAAYTAQVERGADYERASRLFITHVDTGAAAGQIFNRQMEGYRVEVIQPPDSPAPVTLGDPVTGDSSGAYLRAPVRFTGKSAGPVELRWHIFMKNGDSIILRQSLDFETVETVDYYPEDWPMDTIEQLQALVAHIDETVPLPAVVNLHLPPVHYAGGLTLRGRTVNLYGTEGEDKLRTAFLGPVAVEPSDSSPGTISNIDFRGEGAGGTGLTVAAQYTVENCAFTGWDTGLRVAGTHWVQPVGCLFDGNGVGLDYDSGGSYVNDARFTGNTFRHNGTAVLLERVPGDIPLTFPSCRFTGNQINLRNPAGHPADLSYAILE